MEQATSSPAGIEDDMVRHYRRIGDDIRRATESVWGPNSFFAMPRSGRR